MDFTFLRLHINKTTKFYFLINNGRVPGMVNRHNFNLKHNHKMVTRNTRPPPPFNHFKHSNGCIFHKNEYSLSVQYSLMFRGTFSLLLKLKTASVRLFCLTTGLNKLYHTSAQMGIVSWKNCEKQILQTHSLLKFLDIFKNISTIKLSTKYCIHVILHTIYCCLGTVNPKM